MLILTRKEGQQIVIGGEVWVRVLSVSGGKVKLGISGPAEVPVYREEVFQRISEEQAAPDSIRSPQPAMANG